MEDLNKDNSYIAMHPLTLRFLNTRVEGEYRSFFVHHIIKQSRLGVLLGATLWVLYSIIDTFISPAYYNKLIWSITFIVIALAIVAYMTTLSYHFFKRYNQFTLFVVSTIGTLCILLKMWLMPEVAAIHFFPALMLVIVWTHCYSGLRFFNACITTLFSLLLFTIPFGVASPIPTIEYVSYNFYLMATVILAAFAGYNTERTRRELFLGQRALDEDRQKHLNRSLHDSLTGLPNRILLEDRLNKAISLANRDKKAAAAIFIDLDGFKDVNDTYGHDVGDVLLQQVAQRLARVMRESDTLSRIGGDEFFVLAISIKTKASTMVFVEKLLKELKQPYQINDKISIYGITASIGVCMFPYKDCTPADVMRRADQAMYQVKRDGKASMAFASSYRSKSS